MTRTVGVPNAPEPTSPTGEMIPPGDSVGVPKAPLPGMPMVLISVSVATESGVQTLIQAMSMFAVTMPPPPKKSSTCIRSPPEGMSWMLRRDDVAPPVRKATCTPSTNSVIPLACHSMA